MPTVKKTNTIPREIYKSDFQGVGVEDQGKVEFNEGNNFTAEVNDAAAQYLVEHDDFELVEQRASRTSKGDKQ